VRLLPCCDKDAIKHRCEFQIVAKASEQSLGTVADEDATCPSPDCGRVIDGEDVKRQAQQGQMGEQLFAVVIKRAIATKTKGVRTRKNGLMLSGRPQHKMMTPQRLPQD